MDAQCDEARAAFPLFVRSCSMLMDRLDKRLQEKAGIPLSWYKVLVQLDSTSDGRMPMRQLGESVMLSKSGITRLIDRMERAGLVQRHACKDDGRVCFAALTSAGAAALGLARPVAARVVDDFFAQHISAREAEIMTKALIRIMSAAGPSESRSA